MRDSSYFRQFQFPAGATRAYVPVGTATVCESRPEGVRLTAGTTTVEVTALAPDLFRVGMFGEGRRPRYISEAVVETEWDPGAVDIQDEGTSITITTAEARASIQRNPVRVRFEGKDGRRIAEDDPEFGMGFLEFRPEPPGFVDPIGAPFRLYKRRLGNERYFGCGERTGGLEKTHTHQIFWNVDPPSFHTASLNNLYTSIPFLLVLSGEGAWGLFLDSSYRVEFELAEEQTHRSWFGADGGDMVYYLFTGPSPRAVLDRYTELTGRTPLPPLWALGNQQSRWGYESAEEVREIARQFRARNIPCDAIYLDIDYMDGFRVFTWDERRFPDPDGLLEELAEMGFKVVTIVDPGVKVDEDFPVYVEGRNAGLYCKSFLGDEYHNVVWPGVCAFPDFTNPRAREWWGEQHAKLLEQGVAGIWCDMNEPTVFIPTPQTLPPDVTHDGEGEAKLHAQVHNLYGSLMARATREGLLRHRPDRRPLVISRAGYAGLQRHALHWTGDNSSWWEHLWMSLPQIQNLGLSGLAWVGADVGGFTGNCTGELLARWTEAAVFHPFYRNHSARGTRRQEPWMFGGRYEAVIRDMLRLRQRLLPYLYTLFDECHRTGAPIVRPLLFEYPADPETYSADDEFLLGANLLVAPIARGGTEYRHVYLPDSAWRHFWSGGLFRGPAHILSHAPLGRPAVYARANAAIPLWPAMNYVGERPNDPLTLLIFPAEGSGVSTLYEDAGEGFAHERGVYARRQVTCDVSHARIVVEVGAQEGTFAPDRSTIELELRAIGAAPDAVLLNGQTHRAWDWRDGALRIRLPAGPGAMRVQVQGAQTADE